MGVSIVGYDLDHARKFPASSVEIMVAEGAGVVNTNLPTVAIVNRSTLFKDTDGLDLASALAYQVHRHFYPFWGQDANLVWVPSTQSAPRWSWQVVLLDDPDVAGALGYHDKTIVGLPLGKVFTRLTGDLQTTAIVTSHEVLEMLGDPTIILAASLDFSDTSRDYFFEACDPVEDTAYWVVLPSGRSVAVSNFISKQWFDPTLAGQTGQRFDFLSHISQPLQLTGGGYCLYRDFISDGWRQLWGQKAADRQPLLSRYSSVALPPPGSRRERMIRGIGQWRFSTAE